MFRYASTDCCLIGQARVAAQEMESVVLPLTISESYQALSGLLIASLNPGGRLLLAKLEELC